MKYNLTGWKKQPYDPRDRYKVISNKDTKRLSKSADLTPGMGPLLDQGNEGSCGPNTYDELVAYDQKLQGLIVTGSSRLFVYYCTRALLGDVGEDSGVDNRTMMKAGAQFGAPPESIWPYDDSPASMVRKPSAEAYASGLQNLITDYAAVVQSLTQMQGFLDVVRKPFLLGFTCYPQIDSDQASATGILAMPKGSSVGGHDVSCCGYNASGGDMPGIENGKKWPTGTFRFRNHWTLGDGVTPWGDGGYGYMPFAYATDPDEAGDYWSIDSVPGGKPGPGPGPGPGPAGGPTQAQVLTAVDAAVVACFGKPSQLRAMLPWSQILSVVASLIHALGPLAKPTVEAWIATLPLSASQIAAIDSMLDAVT